MRTLKKRRYKSKTYKGGVFRKTSQELAYDTHVMSVLCPESGECVTFGREENKLAGIFDNYNLTNTQIVKNVRKIGGESVNGIVYEVHLSRNFENRTKPNLLLTFQMEKLPENVIKSRIQSTLHPFQANVTVMSKGLRNHITVQISNLDEFRAPDVALHAENKLRRLDIGPIQNIKWTKNFLHNYDVYIILKTCKCNAMLENNCNISDDFDVDYRDIPDNLYYEYLVGIYLNSLYEYYPTFCKTHNIYKYKSVDARNAMQINQTVHSLTQLLPNVDINDSIYNASILCLSTQNVHGAISFEDLFLMYEKCQSPEECKILEYEIFAILYQVYYTLAALKSKFTHHDLHTGNVLLTSAGHDKRFLFNFEDTKVTFKCRYAAKIIDYGRSFIPETPHILKSLNKHYTEHEIKAAGYKIDIIENNCMSVDLRLIFTLSRSKTPVGIQILKFITSTNGTSEYNLTCTNLEKDFNFWNTNKITVDNVCPFLMDKLHGVDENPNVVCNLIICKDKKMIVHWN